MQDFSKIPGGPKRTSASESGESKYRSYLPAKVAKKSSTSSLHKGEVVRGTILDKIDENIALVRLPTGNFRAYLQGNLNKGDSLFFKIVDTAPSLVLRIYAAALSSDGKSIDTQEIIRILNLPPREFYVQLINYFRNFQSTISREELLHIFNNFSLLAESDIKKASTTEIFRLLFFVQELGLPFSRNAFVRLLPVFLGERLLKENLAELENNLENLPQEYREKIAALFKKIYSEKSPFGRSERFIITGMKSDLFDLLASFSEKYKNTQSPQISKVLATVNWILDTIESQHVYNAIAKSYNLPYIFFLPMVFAGALQILQLKVSSKKSKTKKRKEATKFSFATSTKSLGDIDAEFFLDEDNLSISISADDGEALEALTVMKKEIEQELRNLNLKITSITINNKQTSNEEFMMEITKTKQQNFNIVI